MLVQGNTAPEGSGMYLFGGTTDLVHCTFVDNRGDGADGIGLYSRLFASAGDFTLTNAIVAGQETGVYVLSGSGVIDRVLWGDDVWSNTTDWTGSVVVSNETWSDPKLFSTGGEGYHIRESSPARDAGVDLGVLLDMDGEVRPSPDTGVPDLGADEWSMLYESIFLDGFESGDTSAWSSTVQ
jgi:hypothetical protein